VKEFHVRLLQQKIECEFELDFRESTPDPRNASDNDGFYVRF
jgi:hypothetical protein